MGRLDQARRTKHILQEVHIAEDHVLLQELLSTMLSRTLRLSKQLRSSQATAVGCSYLRGSFASQSEAFADEADQFVKAAAKLKGKPDRAAQVKAFAESKEAARRIAEKMSGEAIDWQKEETKARNNLKRKMMEWGKCIVPCCQHSTIWLIVSCIMPAEMCSCQMHTTCTTPSPCYADAGLCMCSP